MQSRPGSGGALPSAGDVRRLAGLLPALLYLTSPPLCPELSLWLTPSVEELWARLGESTDPRPAELPYWAIAWPGGQAIARYLLDHPERARPGRVVDVGAGSGIAAIAAAIAGAGRVLAFDTDPWAAAAIAANSAVNAVEVDVSPADPIGDPGMIGADDVVVVGDLWYERFLGLAATAWLREGARRGATVLVADVGRAYFPRTGLEPLAAYRIDPAPATERVGECRPTLSRLLP